MTPEIRIDKEEVNRGVREISYTLMTITHTTALDYRLEESEEFTETRDISTPAKLFIMRKLENDT